MPERRQHDRKTSDKLLEIIDVNSNQRLGYLVDLSAEGMMVISGEPFQMNNVYQMLIRVPEGSPFFGDIEFGAESLWSDKAHDPQKFWTGFQIIDISDQQAGRIAQLIEGYL